jgi:hypothetical protein
MLNDNSGVTPATLNTAQRTYLQNCIPLSIYIYLKSLVAVVAGAKSRIRINGLETIRSATLLLPRGSTQFTSPVSA